MSRPEIITSARGGRKLLLNGHIYYRRDTEKGIEYWHCVLKDECKGTAITKIENGEIKVRKEGAHSHAPNQGKCQAEIVKAKLKKMADENPEAPPAQLFRRELPNVPEAVLSQLPDR